MITYVIYSILTVSANKTFMGFTNWIVGMEISGLDITLRRISQIESSIQQIEPKEAESSAFKNVLIDKLNSNDTNIPTEFYIKPFANQSSTPKTDFDSYIKKAAQENNIDSNLLKAVIKAESGFNANAKSPVGAQGLMQLMPATAKSLGVENPFDAEQNIKGGAKYLSGLIKRFDGKLENALAAYNAGAGAVNKYGGVPPYKETQNYVKRVLSYHRDFSGF